MANIIFMLVLASSILSLLQAVPGVVCSVNSQCGCNECCQILSDFPVLSRRQTELRIRPPNSKKGTCQPYLTGGQPCSPFSQINGECGCAPGFQCRNVGSPLLPEELAEQRTVRATTDATAQRLIMAGNYQCAPLFTVSK